MMKDIFTNALNVSKEFLRTAKGKAIASCSAVAIIAIAVTVIVINMPKAAATTALIVHSSNESSSAVLSSISTSSVSSDSTSSVSSDITSSSISSSTGSTSSASLSNSSTSATSSKVAVTPPTASSKATSPANTSSKATSTPPSTTTANDPRYVVVPYGSADETKYETVGTTKLALNINAHGVMMTLDLSGVQNYILDDMYITVTDKHGNYLTANNGSTVYNNIYECPLPKIQSWNITIGIDNTYEHDVNGTVKWWLTPDTYTVNVYCKKSGHSLNTEPTRPDTVQVANFSFSVWEQGFAN